MVARMRRPRPAKRAKKGVRRPRRRVAKKSGLNPSNQYATIVETIEFDSVKSDVPYQGTFNLAQFYRATTVAKNFQFYRAKKVKWEYMPLYNTFQQPSTLFPAVGKPQMYFIMNRDQDPYWSTRAPADALFAIQACGADPVPFTKNREIIYKPNWCSPGLTAFTSQPGVPNPNVTSIVSLGLKKQFGWLPTPNTDGYLRPNTKNAVANPIGAQGYNMADIMNAGVIYNGHNWYIEQSNEPDIPVAKLICTVEWEFKLGKQNYSQPVQKLTDVSGADAPAAL